MAEVMVLLILATITLGMTRVMMRGSLWSTQLESAAQSLGSDLAATRVRAITQNRTHRVVFDSDSDTYQVQKNVDGVWQNTGPIKPLGDNVDLLTAHSVVFLSTGIVDQPVTIELKNQKEEARLLSVSIAGHVDIERGTWHQGQGN